MNSLDAWAAEGLAGRRVLQVHLLGDPRASVAVQAARAGAAGVSLMDPAPSLSPAWEAARDAVAKAAAPSGPALECLPWHLLDRRDEEARGPRSWDVVWSANLVFHDADPYAWIRRLAELSSDVVVLRSTRLPEIEGVLREGEMVNAMTDDPRLPEIRRQLEARGVRLPQFERKGRRLGWGGRYLPGMWCWFLTAGALEEMLRDNGFLTEHRFAEWGDLAVSLVARRFR